jgi:hypothetical protein
LRTRRQSSVIILSFALYMVKTKLENGSSERILLGTVTIQSDRDK